MGTSQKNLSNHSFKYKLSFHANKEATYCSWELLEKPQLEKPGPGGRGRDTHETPLQLLCLKGIGLYRNVTQAWDRLAFFWVGSEQHFT